MRKDLKTVLELNLESRGVSQTLFVCEFLNSNVSIFEQISTDKNNRPRFKKLYNLKNSNLESVLDYIENFYWKDGDVDLEHGLLYHLNMALYNLQYKILSINILNPNDSNDRPYYNFIVDRLQSNCNNKILFDFSRLIEATKLKNHYIEQINQKYTSYRLFYMDIKTKKINTVDVEYDKNIFVEKDSVGIKHVEDEIFMLNHRIRYKSLKYVKRGNKLYLYAKPLLEHSTESNSIIK